MNIKYRKGPIRFCEIWFNKNTYINVLKDIQGKADVVIFHESHIPLSNNSMPFCNGVISLERDIDTLFRGFNSGFRNEIRRAEAEGIFTTPCMLIESIDSIYAVYIKFCNLKKIQPYSYSILQKYSNSKKLFLSRASLNSQCIQAHIYIVDEDEVILLASFPLCYDVPRKIVGWANRKLHWTDINFFKQYGILRYNLGGMGNPATEENKSIIAFKNEMSPMNMLYYQDAMPVSWIGNCYFFAKNFYK